MKKLDFSAFKPNFNTEQDLIKHDEEARSKNTKYFTPGLHEVTVKDIDATITDRQGNPVLDAEGQTQFNMCDAPNNTWIKLRYTFEGTGGKEIRSTVLVPLATQIWISAKGAETTFLYKKFINFCRALGLPVETMSATELVETFQDLDRQIGLRLRITTGYEGCHSVIVRKTNEPGGLLLKLVDDKNNDVLKPDGTPVTAGSDEELRMFCRSCKPERKYQGFISVLEYAVSSTPNSFVKKDATPF